MSSALACTCYPCMSCIFHSKFLGICMLLSLDLEIHVSSCLKSGIQRLPGDGIWNMSLDKIFQLDENYSM